jgi:hypothetical protein
VCSAGSPLVLLTRSLRDYIEETRHISRSRSRRLYKMCVVETKGCVCLKSMEKGKDGKCQSASNYSSFSTLFLHKASERESEREMRADERRE